MAGINIPNISVDRNWRLHCSLPSTITTECGHIFTVCTVCSTVVCKIYSTSQYQYLYVDLSIHDHIMPSFSTTKSYGLFNPGKMSLLNIFSTVLYLRKLCLSMNSSKVCLLGDYPLKLNLFFKNTQCFHLLGRTQKYRQNEIFLDKYFESVSGSAWICIDFVRQDPNLDIRQK